ncbi:MAG: hypothetical protein K0R17_1936 [Rariglobus sp.]|jgi:hypothetical protein|nr:hypothetical protein [Rariglobus sp.]
MNFLKYPLVALLAALVSSWVTYRIAQRAPEEIHRPAPSAELRPAVPAVDTPAPGVASVDTAEMERLMRENADLNAQLADTRARLVAHGAALKQTRDELDELRRPMIADLLSSTLRADLKSGEVVVTGGYKLADGRRLYAFAKPSVEQIDGANVVMIEGRYVTLTDEVGKSVGLDNLATNAANTLQHGEVWVPDEEAAVFEKLANTQGTDVMTYPSVSVRPGRSGTINIGNTQLRVTPTLAEDGDGLGMELRLEQPQEAAAAGTAAATPGQETAK